MVTPRTVGAVLFAIGVSLCAMAARGGEHTPAFRAGYWVLAADFHVHGFPGDGALAPRDLIREARRRNLDVIGISDHNQMLPARFGGRTTFAGSGVLAIPSDEVTARLVHIVAVGISSPVDWRQPPAGIIAAVHRQGGVAIAAHPARDSARAFDDEAIRRLDGFEAAHPLMHVRPRGGEELAEFAERARRLKPDISFMGGSDFHAWQPVGMCRSYLLVREINSAGVLDAIRSGRATACDANGRSYGPPEYVRLTEGDCRAHGTDVPQHARMNAIGTAAAWVGLLTLVLFGNPVPKRPANV